MIEEMKSANTKKKKIILAKISDPKISERKTKKLILNKLEKSQAKKSKSNVKVFIIYRQSFNEISK